MNLLKTIKTVIREMEGCDTSPVTISYYWQDGGLSVRIGASSCNADHFINNGFMSVEAYNKAVRIINQGRPFIPQPLGHVHELYATHITLRHGEVAEVKDEYFDHDDFGVVISGKPVPGKWAASDSLAAQFMREFNGPPVKAIKRKI